MRVPVWIVHTTIVLVFFVCAPSGCSDRRSETDTRFDVNKWLFATIGDAERVSVYEGLPDPLEREFFEREKQSKTTADLHGFPFYTPPVELNGPAREALVALLGEGSFQPYLGLKACGAFHPDYAVEWSARDGVYRCLICFTCGEAKIFGPGRELHCDLVSRDPFKRALKPYWKNRPVSEFWPPTPPEQVLPPDKAGEK